MADSGATQSRIFEAALQEFAQHGVAGARVERIAKAASTSKERLYAYFRSKEALYWHVAEDELTRLAEATNLDVTDLPEYAGRIFDYYEDHPMSYRLLTWGQLESPVRGLASDQWNRILEAKVKRVSEAQRQGLLDSSWGAAELLTLVSQTAAAWALKPEPAARPMRRSVVVEAVRRLTKAP